MSFIIVSLETTPQFSSINFLKISNSFEVKDKISSPFFTIFLSKSTSKSNIFIQFFSCFSACSLEEVLLIIVFILAKSSLGENGFAI
jgi:hypothetical protein